MTAFEYEPQERLLRAVAEQLKTPLLHIARQSELEKSQTPLLGSISYTADMAMRMIDSYLLSVQLNGQPLLELEPVSVSSVLHDVAHRLSPLAKSYDHDLEVSLKGKYGPVMAHAPSLEAAYMMLGYSMLEAQAATEKRQRVLLGAHKTSQGIVTGVFGDQEGLSADMFRRARALYGRSRQSMPTLGNGSGAGVMIADSLFHSMAAPMRVAQHHKLSGFAATLLPSQQLQHV
jgi:K+-sensing histidine kinase KdpD